MHPEEADTTPGVVRRLLAAQCPEWEHLLLRPVSSAGTDHALYRLGARMVVRLPRIEAAAAQVAKEHRWLPTLAPHRFIAAVQRIDTAGGPRPGPHNSFRGVPLVQRDAATRAAIAALSGDINTRAATAVREQSLAAPAWDRPLVWIHGDLLPGNLLTKDGHLTAVIDFGCPALGDPACDVMAAWTCLDLSHQQEFRAVTQIDDATWMRARGWALSCGAIALPYYRNTNPPLAATARRALAGVLAEARSQSAE